MKQAEIFPPSLPRGLIYREDFIAADEERQLLSEIQGLPLREAQYQQYTARRRTVSYGSSVPLHPSAIAGRAADPRVSCGRVARTRG